MPKDRDFISSETHELNYLLKKWDKKQNKKNRQILRDTLGQFRDDSSYTPHNRESFYRYVDDHNIKKLLEDLDKKKNAGKKPILPDIEKEDLTIDDPFVHKTKKVKKQKMTKKQKISIQDLTLQRNTHVTEMKLEGKGEIGNKTAEKSLITALIILLVIILVIILVIVGTCLYQEAHDQNSGIPGTENKEDQGQGEPTGNDNDSVATESIAYTSTSLKSFLENCTPIYFKGDLEELLPGEKQKINTLASYLDHYQSVELLIEGHTADIGLPGEEMNLSILRAGVIENFLKQSITKVQLTLTVRGYGAQKKVAVQPTEEAMQLNRRVEITVIKTESE